MSHTTSEDSRVATGSAGTAGAANPESARSRELWSRVLRAWSWAFGARWFLGAVFLLSGVLKAASFDYFVVQISYYGIVREPAVVMAIGLVVIGIETALGFALWTRWGRSRWVLGATWWMLTAFTGLLIYVWIFRDLDDCGCFGKYLRMTPGWSVFKNLGLMGLVWIAWRGPRNRARTGLRKSLRTKMVFGTGGTVVCGVLALAFAGIRDVETTADRGDVANGSRAERDNSPGSSVEGAGEFRGIAFDRGGDQLNTSEGLYLVAMLSESCSGCGDIVRGLNRMAENDELPQVLGLVLGEAEDVRAFRDKYEPRFPIRAMSALPFLARVGAAPPRFHLVKNGVSIKYWDDDLPDEMVLLEFSLLARSE